MNVGRRTSRSRVKGGFTFVEVLAALLFLAVVVPTIVSALSLAGRASELTERGEAASVLAENKLNEMLVDNAWQNGAETSGDCGTDWPNYRWQLTQGTWTTDSASNMTELKVEVFFKVRGTERSVSVSTLVNTLTSSNTSTSTSTSGTTGNQGTGGASGTGTGGTGGTGGRPPTGGGNGGGGNGGNGGTGRPPGGGGGGGRP